MWLSEADHTYPFIFVALYTRYRFSLLCVVFLIQALQAWRIGLRVAECGNRGCKFVLKGIVVFSGVEELGHRCTHREIQNLDNFVILQVFLWLTLRRRSATALYFAFLHRSPCVESLSKGVDDLLWATGILPSVPT
jgi:hypothetical protein